MKIELTEQLYSKLERRINWLRSARFGAFQQALQDFWGFFDNDLLLSEVGEQLIRQFPNAPNNAFHKLHSISSNNPEVSPEERIAIVYSVLRKFSYEENQGRGILNNISQKNMVPVVNTGLTPHEIDQRNLQVFKDLYLEPFFIYLEEQIDNKRAILSVILRYKHRSEWFQQERLLHLYESDTQRGEKLLALDLYQYLFDEGINFTIEPSSIDGKIDLISAQNSDDPLLADAKVFTGAKASICNGFGQIYSYTKKYNEPFGYLVIYNVKGKDLSLLFSNSVSNIPMITYNHKTIFFITIDLYKHKSPSKRGKIKPVEIKEEDLFQYFETNKSE